MVRLLLSLAVLISLLTACNSTGVEVSDGTNVNSTTPHTDGNDSITDAISVLLGETKAVTLNPAGDQDFYKIILKNPTRLVVEAKGVAAGKVVLLSLYDSNGVLLDSVGTELAGIIRASLTAAVHYVKVHFSSPEAFSTSPFYLSFYSDTSDTTEPNNSFETAYPIQTNGTYPTKWSGSGDVDFYRLAVLQGGLYTISTSGVPSANKLRISLYDTNSVLMRYVDAASYVTNGNVSLPFVATLGESYYVKLENLNTTGAATPFSLSVKKDLIDTTEYNNTKESAYPIQLEKTYATKTYPSGDEDFFKLKLADATMLQVRLNQINYSVKPTVSIYDTAGILLTYGSGYYDDTLSAALESGTYFIKVNDQGGGNSDIPYLITFATDPIDTMEFNNTIATASPVEIGKSYSTKMYPVGDIDFYKITIADSMAFSISLKGLTYPISSQVTVLDSSGSKILAGKVGNWSDYTLPVTVSAGVYYVKLENPTTSTADKAFTISFTK